MNRLVFIKAETTKNGTRIYLLPLSTIKQINFTDAKAKLAVWDRDMTEIKTIVGVTNDGTYISLGLDALRSIGDGIFALSLNLQLESESQDYPDKEYFYIKLKHDDQHVILENVWTRDKPYNMFQDETNNNSDSKGHDGKSAYAIWLDSGHNGTEIDFLNWLRGPQGPQGPVGPQGSRGYNFWAMKMTAGGNVSGRYITDLYNASASNLPEVNDLVVQPDGNVFSITNVVKDTTPGAGDGGATFDLGPVLFSIKGYKGDKGDTGPKGDKGDTGPKGDKGDDAVINIISQAEYDALTDKSGVYFIEG